MLANMQAPQYQAPPTDPTVAALDAQAQSADIASMQTNAATDTASIMARYGTRLAMAGTAQPVAAAPLAVVPPPMGRAA